MDKRLGSIATYGTRFSPFPSRLLLYIGLTRNARYIFLPFVLWYFSKCAAVGRRAEVLCEQNRCLQEQDLINEINSNNQLSPLTWKARNYSTFWGRTLNDGIQLRLGTLNPSRSVDIAGTWSTGNEVSANDRSVIQGLQNELCATDLRSWVAATRVRCQIAMAPRDFRRGRSRLVRCILGHFHGARRLWQIRRDEQRCRQRSS